MINVPSTADLLEKVPDRYELIMLVAKRARELQGGSDKLTSFDHVNYLTVAAHEVEEGLVQRVKRVEEAQFENVDLN